jgi:hypothetical protein
VWVEKVIVDGAVSAFLASNQSSKYWRKLVKIPCLDPVVDRYWPNDAENNDYKPRQRRDSYRVF